MIKLFSSLLLIFSFHTAFSQYDNITLAKFLQLEKLDKQISLDENFDYKLLHQAILQFTNLHRLNNRKPILNYNETLEKSAAIHSLEMEKYDFFDHINKRERKFQNLDDRADYVGYKNYLELAENLYYGFIDLRKLPTYRIMAQTIVQALIESKYHNLNLINKDLKEMGTFVVFKNQSEEGFLYYYVTQSFGTPFP